MSLATDADLAVLYPATGPSVGQSPLHVAVCVQAYDALRGHFAGREGCVVRMDHDIYYRPHPEPAFVCPDVFVCFGVDAEALEPTESYRAFDAGPPSFVLEVASHSTHNKDLDEKPAIYWEMGVDEYWRFDPTGEFYTPTLQGDRRAGGAWQRIEVTPDGGGLRGHSAALALDLHAEPGRLRFGDPDTGEWLPDYAEALRQRDAEIASRRAAEDRARAAEARVAALQARLNDRSGDSPR